VRTLSFNSLSWDHVKLEVGGYTIHCAHHVFQLPLLGSPSERRNFPESRFPEISLSTPSLGITRMTLQDLHDDPDVILSTPSLGITFSSSESRCSYFRTLSTPSLGITSATLCKIGEIWSQSFNSLSWDHRAQFRDFSALRGFLPRQPFAQLISKATIWIYRFAPL
jgi:hypothetical protein